MDGTSPGNLSAPSIVVGGEGTGELILSAGATTSVRLTIGDKVDSQGWVTLRGSDTRWDMAYIDTPLVVGKEGSGWLGIQDGANVTVELDINADVVVGQEFGSTGTINVSGVGSKLAVQGDIVVGYEGEGWLQVQDGGLVGGAGLSGSSVDLYIGGPSFGGDTARGNVLIDGEGSKIIAGTLTVGESGNGLLTIQKSGRLEVADGGSVTIGNDPFGQGKVVVKDSGELIFSDTATFGFTVGRQGQGELDIKSGGFVWGQGQTVVGKFLPATGSKVTVDGTGSLWQNGTFVSTGTGIKLAGEIRLNNGATLIVSNGGAVETSLLYAQDSSIIHLDDGNLAVDRLAILSLATLPK